MNPLENELDYPWGDTLPGPGRALEVAADVRWIRMPLPFALDHINLWLLRDRIGDREGWTVVDCGIDRTEVRDCWEAVFEQALDGLPVLRVLVTHMHPDHVGLAHWLCARWQAPLWMSMTDYAVARLWAGSSVADSSVEGSGPSGEGAARHFARHGLVDPQALDMIRARHDYYTRLVPDMPPRFHRLMHGQEVSIGGRGWQVIVGHGHAPEHVSLWCPDLGTLISGDMVLPRISTNVSVFAVEPEGNPLQMYLDSLDKFADLPDDTLVLPAHGKPFRGLHTRIAQLRAHHAARLDEVRAVCAEPKSAVDIVPLMFKRQLDAHQLSFAIGEALAHLHYLWYNGNLARVTGDDGIVRFKLT